LREKERERERPRERERERGVSEKRKSSVYKRKISLFAFTTAFKTSKV
jgi:hypothetical protein